MPDLSLQEKAGQIGLAMNNMDAQPKAGNTNRQDYWWMRFPTLEPQEEYTLAKSWREHGDRAAAHRLATSHLRLVGRTARSFPSLDHDEAVAEGTLGLLQAIDRFNPEKGCRFATYAQHWIIAAIRAHAVRARNIVKLPRGERVRPIDVPFEAPINDAESHEVEYRNALTEDAPSPEDVLISREETEIRREALSCALANLSGRARRIFEARHLASEPITFEQLAAEFGISRERVRQIDNVAFKQVQAAAKNSIGEIEARPPLRTEAEQRKLTYRLLIDWGYSPETAATILEIPGAREVIMNSCWAMPIRIARARHRSRAESQQRHPREHTAREAA